MHRRPLIAGISTLVTGGLAGCLNMPVARGNDDDDPSAELDVEIIESELNREFAGTDDERVWVAGTAINRGTEELSYVEIRARFFDAEDEQLDSTVENISDVTESSRWPFEIEFPRIGEEAAQVVDYDLAVVTTL